MGTYEQYLEVGKIVRSYIMKEEPIPKEYQEVVEWFLPTEDKFPDKRVITLYEFASNNPRNHLENKRGFRNRFMLVFLTNPQAAEYICILCSFHQELTANHPLKYIVARYIMEIVENMIFIRTRGQRIQNLLSKLEKVGITMPICAFHYDMKERELIKRLDEQKWCLRIKWGPPNCAPLLGCTEAEFEEGLKIEVLPKNETKMESFDIKCESEPQRSKKVCKKEEASQEQSTATTSQQGFNIILKPTEYYIQMAKDHAQQIKTGLKGEQKYEFKSEKL